MGSDSPPLHVFFFPLMAHGHMIPMVDMAGLFGSRGVHCTIVTTPANQPFISKSIGKVQCLGFEIRVRTIPFPAAKAGLPEGCENLDMVPSPAYVNNFVEASMLLREPFEELLEEERPDCLVGDMFFPWSTESAAKLGIPRLVFHGTSYFALCAGEVVRAEKPYLFASSDTEPFVIPGLPDEIKLTRSQLPMNLLENKSMILAQVLDDARTSELTSFGVVFNSFYELEPAYADYYTTVLKRRAWQIGPLSLCNRDAEEKAARGKQSSIDQHECLKWLDSKEPDSVVYVCFGSTCKFLDDQLAEIASALEASGQNFIWVIRRISESEPEHFLPEGFEERVQDRALLIRGWAPQVLILDHPSVGGFVSHCGWNSTLEAISAGLPMVTWPVFAEQFYNEKLVTDLLKIGVSVGTQKWAQLVGDHVQKETIQKAVLQIMEGEEAAERRSRARQLGMLARQAVEKDGSSYTSLTNLLADLKKSKKVYSSSTSQNSTTV
uniref:Glycosyltransferase n=1 Tax=Kalanchoe fedtschenkoi TaxID=63787 RepID=A0A7N0TVT3_KALFE